jgi:lipopolysaccharide export system protein LptA
MIKYLSLLFIFGLTLLSAGEVEIKADSFYADEKSQKSTFSGHVHVTKASDELFCDTLDLHFNAKKDVIKYDAQGSVVFKISVEKGSVYSGQANRVVYLPQKGEYHFYKNVHLTEINTGRFVKGNEVILNQLKGSAVVVGAKKEPVIMRFNVEEKGEKK